MPNKDGQLADGAERHFDALIDSAGVKRFAASLGLTARQVNRMRSGAQPNPIERLIRCLQAAEPEVGDLVLDYICQEMGGHFVRMQPINSAIVNAVKECAEAIAAISDGHVCDHDIREVREAISALTSLTMTIRKDRGQGPGGPGGPGSSGSTPPGGA